MKSRNEVVVITGASAGVGRATAHEFAREGAYIGLLARDRAALEQAKREVEQLGGQAVAIPTDVADPTQVEAAATQVEARFGPIDIWVNNAMTTIFSPLHEIPPDEFRRATEVTYLGTVHGTMAALKRMMPRDRGVIVQVGSALSYRAIPLQAAYCGAKHAIRGFTDSLRCELLHDKRNIHLTMVQLPALNTPQFNWCKSRLPRHPQPVPPIFQPEVAARAIVWSAHHRRRETSVGMPTLMAIWGNKFFPRLGDRRLAKMGYQQQQTDQPISPDRPANLFEPVAGQHATRGIFDQRSATTSWQWWANTHRGLVLGTVLTAVAGVAWASWQAKKGIAGPSPRTRGNRPPRFPLPLPQREGSNGRHFQRSWRQAWEACCDFARSSVDSSTSYQRQRFTSKRTPRGRP